MELTKFKLLIWKNVRLRRYHWFVTAVEFLLPIALTFFLVKIMDFSHTEMSVNDARIFPTEFGTKYQNELKNTTLFYSPLNRAVDDFMDQIKGYFGSIVGFANESSLKAALKKESNEWRDRRIHIGVCFNNIVSNVSLPNELSYVLRNTDTWETKQLYSGVDRSGPEIEDLYKSKHFIGIQLVLNENFIRNKTKQNKLPLLEIGWFPYPEYVSGHRQDRQDIRMIGFVDVLVIFISLVLSIPLINDIIEEKDSGVKELMKISGLNEWMVWSSWFLHGIIASIITFPIVLWILMHPFYEPDSEVIHFVQYSVMLFFILLYCTANVSFCFMFSSIFHKATIASSMFSMYVMVIYSGVYYLTTPGNASKWVLKLFTFTPIGAFKLGFHKMAYYEKQGFEFTWSSAFVSGNSGVSLAFCMFMLAFDTFLYFFLAYYIASINPGKFGVRKSPFFIFQRLSSFWSEKKEVELCLRNYYGRSDDQFFESVPSNLEATIRIKDLHKRFGSVYAVNGVDLNIYHGEMTALLGHNGAGKTTTMAIMTGLTSPCAGSIQFKDIDIFENMETFRRSLGMCPQENRTMPYLTVLDHLLFFGQLKGASLEQAKIEADEYLTMMDMQTKKNSFVKELSGGMKRKLCLSIALMGKAQVLILDEPTSGMDVQSRRKLWDLLLGLRGKRTIIFTTHYMEEADALGDRIAIMNHGVIVCHGTPIFLKKAYGTGYELTITKINEELRGVDQIIRDVLPSANVEFESSTEIVYKLPLTETSKFPILFRNLESGMAQFGIKEMGIAATTMEHVFLKVGGISAHDTKSSNNTSARTNGELRHINYVKGITLTIQQMTMLFKKKMWFTSRNPFIILTQIIIPTFLGLFLLSMNNYVNVQIFLSEPSLDLSMNTYPDTTVMMRDNGKVSKFNDYLSEYIAEKGGKLVNSRNLNIEEELLKYARDIDTYNNNFITAFESNSNTMKILYNTKLLHSLPVSITTYSNVLLRSITGDDTYRIETFNHPVGGPVRISECHSKVLSAMIFCVVWFLGMAFYTVDLTFYFSTFVNMERIDGFFHIQTMSNLSPLLYWGSTLISDMAFFVIVTMIRVGAFKIVDHSEFLGFDSSLGVLMLILIFYGISGLLFIYLISYLSNSKERSSFSTVFNLIGTVAVVIHHLSDKFADHEKFSFFDSMLFYVIKYFILLVPSLNFFSLFFKMMLIFNQDNFSCANVDESRRESYFEFPSKENPDGLMLGITFLLIDTVLYAGLLSLVNMGYVRYWFEAAKNLIFGTETTNKDRGDGDVQQEFHKVQMYKNDMTENRIALLADELRKNYVTRFKPLTAVSNVNFVVKPGECFGLLGVNGAGKSTTFKMLTGETLPTLGDSSIERVKLSANKTRYLSMAGYCPQTNCFIEVLTGREMLTMIAALRGVHSGENRRLVNKWMSIMGLKEFGDKRCGTYSGGNKRKLCTAMSLIGDPRVVFLDEPTSGVDPVSRRNLYDVMGQSKEAGQAVILTSHSMEECETLCDRITIMVAGVMKCIGTAQHLKKSYAQGFSVLIKLYDIPNFDTQVSMLKNYMSQTFTERACVLKDEHRGLLYYQIKDTSVPWSTLFEKMEGVRSVYHGLVEDYVLTDTTLEEVFMSFAKEPESSIRL